MTAATDASITRWTTLAARKQIRQRLLKLEVMARDDPHRDAVIRFGIAYEEAIVQWLASTAGDRDGPTAPR